MIMRIMLNLISQPLACLVLLCLLFTPVLTSGCSGQSGKVELISDGTPLTEPVNPGAGTPSATIDPSPSPTATETPPEIIWIWDWEEAKTRAQAENKPIVINFFTDLCPACRRLDQNTFTDDEVKGFLSENFITVKSNAGKTGLFMNYGISAVPTTVFTTPDGVEFGRITGYYPPESFLNGSSQGLNIWEDLQDSEL